MENIFFLFFEYHIQMWFLKRKEKQKGKTEKRENRKKKQKNKHFKEIGLLLL